MFDTSSSTGQNANEESFDNREATTEIPDDISADLHRSDPPSRRSLDSENLQGDDNAAQSQWQRKYGKPDVQRMDAGRPTQILSDSRSFTSHTSRSGSAVGREEETDSGLLTARFKHVVTKEGHAVIVGRDGDTLQRCEDEPIHIPGAVQQFGLLIALKEVDEKFQVRIVSENSKRIIGYTPKQLFELDSFCDILSEDQIENLLDHVDFIKDEDVDPATSGPEVFTTSLRTPSRKLKKLWCAIHVNEKNHDLIICEFELEDDPVNPLAPMHEPTPEPPEDTLESNPTPEELAESTINASKPLRMLRNARKRQGEAAAMEVFNVMSQVQEQLASASTLDIFLKILVGVVKELTGFHRTMIYQFDASWNGRVVTELVDPRATKDLYKGLNFPASDIPKQARDLYKINKVRLLYDREQETARLVCRTSADLENPLDLTFAYLRAMSPIHIKYLGNMAVRSSMSISINAFNELWGLIACHSYGSKGTRVSFPVRKMCRLVGDSASRNIERLSYASRLQARKLINTVPTKSNPSGYIIASSEDLLKLFDADSGMLSIRDETKILGKPQQTQEALVMLEYLKMRKITSVMTSTDLAVDFPDLGYQPGFSVVAGLLLVPLTVSGHDFIVFFRNSQTREVKWAGNPYEKYVKEGTEGYLEPRKSFKTWSETVVGRCREWTEEQIETAAVLCLVYGKFIEVWRQKETAIQTSQLTKILLANSAHEVRTPLNAIINYLEIALEGHIDQETRENLSKSHSASKSLIYVINDLLDLTKAEEGHDLIKDEIFDLPATIKEASNQFEGDAKRKNLEYNTIIHPGPPRYVVGDQRRVRQVIANVTANAVKHTTSGAVRIEMWLANQSEDSVDIDIVVQDTGVGMSASKLDALFNDLEQVQTELDPILPKQLTPDAKAEHDSEKPTQPKRVLGLGLALVARILRNMNGQLRLKSEEGKGSRFVVQMKFELPPEDKKPTLLEGMEKAGLGPPKNQPSTPPVQEGEVMLINSIQRKANKPDSQQIIRRRSVSSSKSMTSLKSFRSGSSNKSEVDRLIDAIQEPLLVGSSGDSESTVKPSSSRDHGRPSSSSSSHKPTTLSRSHSHSKQPSGFSETTRQTQNIPGEQIVVDSKTPIKPVRLPEEDSAGSIQVEPSLPDAVARSPGRALFNVSNDHKGEQKSRDPAQLQALVAEDDPINSKIMKKRLEKIGHDVHLTINGEECASTYGDNAAFFDVVLMDMQVS